MKPKEFNAGVELLGMMALKKIVDGIPLDRLEEICNAERDGRCAALPCFFDDTFYDISEGRIETYKLEHIMPLRGGCLKICGANDHARICAPASFVGITMFFDYKKAEAALKEGK
jgi:hypothetical protein